MVPLPPLGHGIILLGMWCLSCGGRKGLRALLLRPSPRANELLPTMQSLCRGHATDARFPTFCPLKPHPPTQPPQHHHSSSSSSMSTTPAKEDATSDPAEAAPAQAAAPDSSPAGGADADAHDAATEDNKRPAAETETEAEGEAAASPAAAPAPTKKPRNAPPPPISATSEYVTEETTFLIPKASIKRIMKLDPDTKQLSQDAIMLVAKATELFVDKLAKASHAMAVANKRKTIKYEDIADARLSDKALEFLDGVVPQIP